LLVLDCSEISLIKIEQYREILTFYGLNEQVILIHKEEGFFIIDLLQQLTKEIRVI
jgi:hypothetical protein